MEVISRVFESLKVFFTSIYTVALLGTAFSYFMWFLILLFTVLSLWIIWKLKLYIIPALPVKALIFLFSIPGNFRDSDGDGIRDKKDKDKNGDGILDKVQPSNIFRRR